MKRYQHSVHGFHDAYSFEEEQFLEKRGWKPVLPADASREEVMASNEDEAATLRTQLTELGITFRANATLETLKKLRAEA